MRRLFFEIKYLLGKAPWDTGVSPPELIEFLQNHPPGRALDLGCGTGTNALTIASYGWQVRGVDLSWKAIRTARRKARKSGLAVTFQQHDVTRLPAEEGAYDLILDIGCFHSLPDEGKGRYARFVQGALKPGGSYLLYTWLAPQEGAMAPTEEQIRAYFAGGLQLLSVRKGDDQAGRRPSAWFHFQRAG